MSEGNIILIVLGALLALCNIASVTVLVTMSSRMGKVCQQVEEDNKRITKLENACPLCVK